MRQAAKNSINMEFLAALFLIRVWFIREQTAQSVLNLDEHKPSKKRQASSLENPDFYSCEQTPKGEAPANNYKNYIKYKNYC